MRIEARHQAPRQRRSAWLVLIDRAEALLKERSVDHPRHRCRFAFVVIGVLLGWLFLKEKVSLVCWSGIGLTFRELHYLLALG